MRDLESLRDDGRRRRQGPRKRPATRESRREHIAAHGGASRRHCAATPQRSGARSRGTPAGRNRQANRVLCGSRTEGHHMRRMRAHGEGRCAVRALRESVSERNEGGSMPIRIPMHIFVPGSLSAYRYVADDAPTAPIGDIWIYKYALPRQPPQRIIVTIEEQA